MQRIPLYMASLLTVRGTVRGTGTNKITISGFVEVNGILQAFVQKESVQTSGGDSFYTANFFLQGDYLVYLNIAYDNPVARQNVDIISAYIQRGESGDGGRIFSFPPGIATNRNPYIWPSKQDMSLNNLSRQFYEQTGTTSMINGIKFVAQSRNLVKITSFHFKLENDATVADRTVYSALTGILSSTAPTLSPKTVKTANETLEITGILRGGTDISNSDHQFVSLPDRWLTKDEELRCNVNNIQGGDNVDLSVQYIAMFEDL